MTSVRSCHYNWSIDTTIEHLFRIYSDAIGWALILSSQLPIAVLFQSLPNLAEFNHMKSSLTFISWVDCRTTCPPTPDSSLNWA